MEINKAFWRKNALSPMSFAQLTYTKMAFAHAPKMEGRIEEMAYEQLLPARQQQIDRERAEIAQLADAEEVLRYMRGSFDVLNQSALVRKAVSMQEQVMPLLLHRYLTTAQDNFIETAAFAFAAADPCYARALYEQYGQIRSPYARAQACIVFGVQRLEGLDEFLLGEYERLAEETSKETLQEGPLMALHILHGKL